MVVKRFCHARSGVEAVSGQFLGKFGQVVFHGHVFGTEETYFPFVAQAESEDEFVDEF